ncbi:hypothetical protein ACFX2C_044340 [Malus domestica]
MNDFTSYLVGGVAELFEDVNAKDTSYNMVNNFFSFPENCELHQALGTLPQRQTDENLWDPTIGIDDTCNSSSLQKDLASRVEPSWFSKGSDAENLVKAFVAKDETSSSRSDNTKSSITSSSQFPASFKQLKFETCAPIGSGSVTWNQSSALLARGATPASFTDMMSTLVDEEQHGKGYKSVKPKREQKLSDGTATKTTASAGYLQCAPSRLVILISALGLLSFMFSVELLLQLKQAQAAGPSSLMLQSLLTLRWGGQDATLQSCVVWFQI